MKKVEMLGVFGDDLMIANVARVSYGKEVELFSERDAKLIKYLIEHKHTSPFRHPHVQFRITCPIYVERQLFKHQVGLSANSISGRYVDFSDSYTKVDVWRKQSTSSKQGSEGIVEDQEYCSQLEDNVIESCRLAYKALLYEGVSKEQARTILPLNLNTTFIWTGSLLSFLHLFDLRLKPDAQQETREVVAEMKELLVESGYFSNTFKYWKNEE
jgi:thymidylate synthase (FAD)